MTSRYLSGETMRINAKSLALLAAILTAACAAAPALAADNALLGAWVAQSVQVDGETKTGAVANRIRFTFQGDMLTIRGNFSDDREQACTKFSTDANKAPKQMDCVLGPADLLLGIYEVKDDELRLCLRHASFSEEGRPSAFATAPDSHLVLMVMRKESR
jgi:uncharacterized protein (TIGR03067 family)